MEYKKKKVLNNLQRIGGLESLPEFDVIGMEEPYGYRNKAQFIQPDWKYQMKKSKNIKKEKCLKI